MSHRSSVATKHCSISATSAALLIGPWRTPQGSWERDLLPSCLRNVADQSLLMVTAVSSITTSRVVYKIALLTNPVPPRSRHVDAVLLGCPQAFFERDVMTIRKPPERTAAAPPRSNGYPRADLIN